MGEREGVRQGSEGEREREGEGEGTHLNNGLGSFSPRLGDAPHVGGELIEQVVDNVRREDADVVLVSHGLSLRVDADIKGKDGGKLRLALFVHDVGTHHVLFVDGADVDVADGDGRLALVSQKLQQSLEGTQRGGVHHDALGVGF